MTLTQAEREAVAYGALLKANAEADNSEVLDTAERDLTVLSTLVTRLLSSRAVPMETVGWEHTLHTEGGPLRRLETYKSVDPFGVPGEDFCDTYTVSVEPLVLRSAAEAYTEGLRAMVEKLEAALTPSAETKAAYMGEFRFWIDEHDEEGQRIGQRIIAVPWTTIKEVMAAISARALTSTETPKDGL